MNKTSEIVAKLMAINGDEVETYICEWLTRLLKNHTVKNLLDLAENNSVWLELAELGKFKTVALEAPYFSNKNLPNFVKLLDIIWQREKGIHLFSYFKDYLAEVFNPDFVFVENFEDCIYSHTHEIVHIIVISFLLTCMMILHTHHSEDGLEQLFDCLDDMDDEIKTLLKEEFQLIIELYDCIEEDFIEESIIPEQNQPDVANVNRARGLTSVAEQHIVKKVEEFQKTIDELKAENQELKSKTNSLLNELSEKDNIITEQDMKLKQLEFARNDLLDKLKNKQFEMINEEIKDKQKEIDDLKETLANIENKYQKRLRDAEETKDELAKKLHQMENYKSEFETLRRATESQRREVKDNTSDEEIAKLREQIIKLQQKSLDDKQRCLNFEMQVSEITMQAQRLRLENQDLIYRIKELENDRSLGSSEIYVDDFEAIKEELNAAKHYKKLNQSNENKDTDNILDQIDKHGETKISPFTEPSDLNDTDKEYSKKRVEQLFTDYEKKCLHRIKMILKEFHEYKEKLSETLKELEDLKEYTEELEEKIGNLETRAVENIVISSKELKELIYNVKNSERDSSEIAQDLLKNIVRKDHEIARLRHNRKRRQKELLDLETSYTDKISLIYEIIENYVSN